MKVLDKLARGFASKTDADIAAEIDDLRTEKRKLARGAGRFREDAVAQATALVTTAREQFDGAVLSATQHGIPSDAVRNPDAARLAALSVAASPQFEAALLAAVAAVPDAMFEAGSRVEHEAKLADFERTIEERTIELERRRCAASVEAAQAEFEALAK